MILHVSAIIYFKVYCHLSFLIDYLFAQAVIHTVRLPKQSTVGDVLDDLKTKVSIATLIFPVMMYISPSYIE